MVDIRKGFENSIPVRLFCDGESRAKQSFRDECDVNNILKKWEKTGLVSHVNPGSPQYGDFSNVVDYQSALDTVQRADDAFMSLPSSVRDKFNNSPQAFFDFVHDEKNIPELIRLGLATSVAPVEASTTTTQAVNSDG